MRRIFSLAVVLAVIASLMLVAPMAASGSDGFGDPNKVWLCHFDDGHAATQPYTDDRNGAALGFWTVDKPPYPITYLDGDYIVKWNAASHAGIPAGLNPGQVALCNGNGGEFIRVSVKSLGSDVDVRGHRAQLVDLNLPTYPDGWKG